MKNLIGRRRFLRQSAVVSAMSLIPSRRLGAANRPAEAGLEGPFEDLHVHLDNSTIEKVLALPAARSVKLGIVEHAGTKENQYPVVLSNDAELKARNTMLEGKPVYKGIQAEWTDWMGCFSRAALAQLDFVLADTMTFPGKDGQRVKLWEPGVETRVDMADKEAFMARYVDWHVEILSKQPIDVLANVSWLPAPLANDYEKFWTPERMQKVFDAAARRPRPAPPSPTRWRRPPGRPRASPRGAAAGRRSATPTRSSAGRPGCMRHRERERGGHPPGWFYNETG